MLVLRVLVRVRVRAAVGMAMLVLVLDVLVRMGMSRAVVLVFVGMAIACFHFDFIVYKMNPLLSPRPQSNGRYVRAGLEPPGPPGTFRERADVAQLVEQLFRK